MAIEKTNAKTGRSLSSLFHCCWEGETAHTRGAGAALPGLEFCVWILDKQIFPLAGGSLWSNLNLTLRGKDYAGFCLSEK